MWTHRLLLVDANRIGVERRTVAAIEAGDPRASLGKTFDAADIWGVPLFGAEDRAGRCCPLAWGRDVLPIARVDRPPGGRRLF